MFVTNWISTTKIQKISEITNFFRHYFLSRTEVGNKIERLRADETLGMGTHSAQFISSVFERIKVGSIPTIGRNLHKPNEEFVNNFNGSNVCH